MTTKETLQAFEEKAPRVKTYLDSFKAARERAKEFPDADQIEKQLKAEIRGALRALVLTEIITASERKTLFIYYTL